jgi:hypothetical protein
MAAKVGRLGGAVMRRGKVRRRSSGWRRCLHGVVVEAEGRGEAGEAPGAAAGATREKGRRREVGGDPDMRAPLAVR